MIKLKRLLTQSMFDKLQEMFREYRSTKKLKDMCYASKITGMGTQGSNTVELNFHYQDIATRRKGYNYLVSMGFPKKSMTFVNSKPLRKDGKYEFARNEFPYMLVVDSKYL